MHISSVRQPPHNPLKRHQRNSIGRKRSQYTRSKSPPEPPNPIPPPNRPRRILPPVEFSLTVPQQLSPKWVRHDALFYNIGGIGREPEDLGR